MSEIINKERAIRSIVSSAVKAYANGFSMRHLAEVNNENGVINMKIHNVFIGKHRVIHIIGRKFLAVNRYFPLINRGFFTFPLSEGISAELRLCKLCAAG